MAITGYFIDDSWSFREVLLGFEPLSGSHTGANLGRVLLNVLEKYHMTQRVLAITTDNASNNTTLVQFVHESEKNIQMIRIPCIAHIIQLCLVDLLDDLKLQPRNSTAEKVWTEEQKKSIENTQTQGIKGTLAKVHPNSH